MFLNAQARPRHDTAKNQYWDGEIGLWPVRHAVKLKSGKNNVKMKWKNTTVGP